MTKEKENELQRIWKWITYIHTPSGCPTDWKTINKNDRLLFWKLKHKYDALNEHVIKAAKMLGKYQEKLKKYKQSKIQIEYKIPKDIENRLRGYLNRFRSDFAAINKRCVSMDVDYIIKQIFER